MIVLIIIVITLLVLFGMPLFTVLGSIALIAFNRSDIDIASVGVERFYMQHFSKPDLDEFSEVFDSLGA